MTDEDWRAPSTGAPPPAVAGETYPPAPPPGPTGRATRAESVGLATLWGGVAGAVIGALAGTLIVPLYGTLFGGFFGGLVGVGLGVVNGLVVAAAHGAVRTTRRAAAVGAVTSAVAGGVVAAGALSTDGYGVLEREDVPVALGFAALCALIGAALAPGAVRRTPRWSAWTGRALAAGGGATAGGTVGGIGGLLILDHLPGTAETWMVPVVAGMVAGAAIALVPGWVRRRRPPTVRV